MWDFRTRQPKIDLWQICFPSDFLLQIKMMTTQNQNRAGKKQKLLKRKILENKNFFKNGELNTAGWNLMKMKRRYIVHHVKISHKAAAHFVEGSTAFRIDYIKAHENSSAHVMAEKKIQYSSWKRKTSRLFAPILVMLGQQPVLLLMPYSLCPDALK